MAKAMQALFIEASELFEQQLSKKKIRRYSFLITQNLHLRLLHLHIGL
jgi:hypothetical protein